MNQQKRGRLHESVKEGDCESVKEDDYESVKERTIVNQ